MNKYNANTIYSHFKFYYLTNWKMIFRLGEV